MNTDSRSSFAMDRSLRVPASSPARGLGLVDIENLIRKPRPTLEEVQRARDAYLAGVAYQPGDLTVIACNHGASQAVGFGWRNCRLLIRSGRDGADLALVEAMEEEAVASRFSRATIASGDGIFADAVVALESRGVEVTVVYPPGGLSTRLRLASSHQVPFHFRMPEGSPLEGAAA